MLIYHGSADIVEAPEIRAPNRTLDFGLGFYTTSNMEQASTFAGMVVARMKKAGKTPKGKYVNIYNFNYEANSNKLSILTFKSAGYEWLTFVAANRVGHSVRDDYDLIIGPVANDRVYRVLTAYDLGVYDENEALRRIKAFDLYDQYVFKTEKALKYLFFERYILEDGNHHER
jgi:hypothetical protein